MNQLRVLQISHSYEGPFVRICNQYATAFKDHHITTVLLKGEYAAEVEKRIGGNEIKFFEQEKSKLRGMKVSAMMQMAALFRESHFDIVIAHRYKAIYIAGMMSYFFSIPLILGVAHEHEVFKRITRKLFVTLWRRNIMLVGVSQSVSQNILKYCPSLGPKGRIHNLPNALDIEQEKSILQRSEARDVLCLDQKETIVGTVGRLVAKKNHEILIQAFSAIDSQDTKLLIIGDGPRKNELQLFASNLGIEDRVVFAGHHENAYRLMKAIDLFVLPSGKEEAFGIVLLEAMLARVPILSSDAAGPKEVLGDRANFFKLGDVDNLIHKLSCLLDQNDMQNRHLTEEGYQRVCDLYSYAGFKQKLLKLPGLNELLD